MKLERAFSLGECAIRRALDQRSCIVCPCHVRPGSWLLTHELLAAGFIAALLLHIVGAPLRGEGRTMWFEARDWGDIIVTLANFPRKRA
jgi:hypothetical protein